jgi:hypothetical protein
MKKVLGLVMLLALTPVFGQYERGEIEGAPVEWEMIGGGAALTIQFRDTDTGESWRATPAYRQISHTTGWSWAKYGVAFPSKGGACEDPVSIIIDTSCASDNCSSTYQECLDCANNRLLLARSEEANGYGIFDKQQPGDVQLGLARDLMGWSYEVNQCYEKYK